jgi:hypothetical protein
MFIKNRVSSKDSIDIISQQNCVSCVFFRLFEELLSDLSIEFCEIDVGLNNFIKGIVDFVLI